MTARGNRRFFETLTLVVGVVAVMVLASCQSSTQPSAPEPKETQPAAEANRSADPSAPGANAPAAAGGSPSSPEAGEGVALRQEGGEIVPPGGGGPQEGIGEVARAQEIERQRKSVIVESLVKSARTAIEASEYQRALTFLEQALGLEPNNAEAIQMRQQVGAILGLTTDRIQTVSEIMRDEIEVRKQEARQRAEVLFREGEEALQQQQYVAAIDSFGKVVEIIDWAPYELNLSTLRERAENLKRQAELERAKWEAEQKKSQLETARRTAIEEERRRQEHRLERIRLLFGESVRAMELREYEAAERLCGEILSLDPGNWDATRLKTLAVEAGHDRLRADHLEARIIEWNQFVRDIEESRIPYASILRYPSLDDWKMIESRKAGEGAIEVLAEQKSERERFIESQLETAEFTISTEKMPLAEVVDIMRTTGRIDIVIDRSVTEKFTEEELQVNINVRKLKLKNALNLILSLNDLTYTIRKGVVYITTKDSEYQEKPLIRLHDVRDLLVSIKDFPGPNISLSAADASGGGPGGAIFTEEEGGGQVITSEEIVDLVKETVAPESWEPPNSIQLVSGQLLVVNKPEVQAEVEGFLNDLRGFSRAMVHIESRFLTVTDDFLQHIGVDLRGLGISAGPRDNQSSRIGDIEVIQNDLNQLDGGQFDNNGRLLTVNQPFQPAAGYFFTDQGGNYSVMARNEALSDRALGNRLNTVGGLSMQIAILDDAQYQWVVRAVEKEQKATVLSSPRLTVYNTQRANIRVLQQVTYIKDFDVTVAQTAVIADPIVGVVQEGLVLDVRPTISHDRTAITMEVRPKVIDLDNVTFPPDGFRRVTTTLGGNTVPVVIEVPNLIERSVETTVRVPDKGAVIIGGLKESRIFDQKAEVPFFNKIPFLSFFFGTKGKDEENQMLIIVLHGTIVDLEEEQERQVGIRR